VPASSSGDCLIVAEEVAAELLGAQGCTGRSGSAHNSGERYLYCEEGPQARGSVLDIVYEASTALMGSPSALSSRDSPAQQMQRPATQFSAPFVLSAIRHAADQVERGCGALPV